MVNDWTFYLDKFFKITLSLGVIILIIMVGFFILSNQSIAYKQLSNKCDNSFGEGNWTIQETRIRTNWYSIGQEFTCVQNETENYLNEVIN